MQVHYTYDVESWVGSWTDMGVRLPAAFRPLAYGRPPHDRVALQFFGRAGQLPCRYGVKAKVRRLIRAHG